MADLAAGGMSNSAGGYNGRSTANGHSRAGGPVPVPSSAAGVRGPREVMRDREAREARKKAENEARERQEQENLRRAQEDRRRSVERRSTGAVGVAGASGISGGDGATYRRTSGAAEIDRGGPSTAEAPPIPAARMPGTAPVTSSTTMPSGRAVAGGGATRPRANTGGTYNPRPVQPPPTSTAAPNVTRGSGPPPPAKPTTTTAGAAPAGAPPTAAPTTTARPTGAAPDSTPRQPNVSTFPHAFERWETLSSQWEGLTSYWIRRLEQNREEVSREPLAQQMSRQITDLSAAGANLFHAVVELQRLRASSERKFQRWFFETRADQERSREIQAGLEEDVRREREQRTAAVQELSRLTTEVTRLTTENTTVEKRLGEMRRELQISKEEARRAWEELGRREQDERERTDSLREGQPTMIRGIQVVPMGQAGGLSRGGSMNQPTTDEGMYQADQAVGGGYSVESGHYEGEGPVQGYGGGAVDDRRQRRRPLSDPEDPFVERSRHERYTTDESIPSEVVQQQTLPVTNGTSSRGRAYAVGSSSQSMAGPTQTSSLGGAPGGPSSSRVPYGVAGLDVPTSSGGAPTSFYQQHQGTSIHSPSYVSGPPGRDQTRSAASVPSEEGTVSEDDYEIDEHGQYRLDADGRPIVYRRGDYGSIRVSGGGGAEYGPPVTTAGWSGGPADYSGAGYGGAWENSSSRHHHQTRLSDVQEEDERSRTSVSSRR